MLKHLFKVTADEYDNNHQSSFSSEFKADYTGKYKNLFVHKHSKGVDFTGDYVILTPTEVVGLIRWLVAWLSEYSEQEAQNKVNETINKLRKKSDG